MSGAKLGRRIRAFRIYNHLTQQELAERLGTTRCTVENWERSTRLPAPYFVKPIASLLRTSEAEIVWRIYKEHLEGDREGKRRW